MRKILFVSYGGGHINNLSPIIKKIKNEPNIKIDILALTTAQVALQNENVNFIGYKDLPFELPLRAHETGIQLLNQLNIQKINQEESISYLGWNMLDLEEQYGQQLAWEKYNQFGRACFYPINLMKKVLKSYTPDLVVATSAPRSEKAAIDAAGLLGIPSVCIPDCVANYELDMWLSDPSFSTMICAATEAMKKRLVSGGRSSASVTVTGAPALQDFMFPYKNHEIEMLKEKFKIDKNKKVILYASCPESSKHAFTKEPGDETLPFKIFDFLLNYLKNKKDLILVYRSHPSLSHKVSSSSTDTIILDTGFNLKDIISCSDLLITTASTVGIQAQLLKKSLICMNMSIYSKDLYYEDYGPCVRVNDLNDAKKILDEEIANLELAQGERFNANFPFSHPVKNVIKVLNSVGDLQIHD